MTTTLVLKDVARHFGGVPAVDGVSMISAYSLTPAAR